MYGCNQLYNEQSQITGLGTYTDIHMYIVGVANKFIDPLINMAKGLKLQINKHKMQHIIGRIMQ